MSVLNRNVTRTILNATETTEKTNTVASSALAFPMTTSDFFYLGFKERFTTRYFYFSTANINVCALTVEYWNGSAWAAVEDLVDQTLGFTRSGFISWINNTDWHTSTQAPINDLKLYWIRVKVSANLSAGTQLQALLNLFSDDVLLRAYYPEIVDDSRYLPPGRTDFIEQHKAAKDLVVLRLTQMKSIEKESQIIEVNEVAVAATHACAYLILNPIAVDESTRLRRDKAFDDFNLELKQMQASFDLDEDGVIDSTEEKLGTIFVVRS